MDVDPWVEEVRVAMALNGGVSLAVWMGGCAVELDRARRTRCRWRPDDPGADAADTGVAATYRALCDAFRREFVVDVMSGSSAGGINGALLAAAMQHRRVLGADFVRGRWLDLGDFGKLLQPLSARAPTSLMRGTYFAEQLEATFDQLVTKSELTSDAPSLTPALDVTTTDVLGKPITFRDTWGGTLDAREYRARFCFRGEDDFTPARLAAAARSSASFPLAFEPFDVPEAARPLCGLDDRRWVLDGGLLDNAPIRAALSLIPGRPATRQVRRFLCYLNGDPAGAAAKALKDTGPTTSQVIGMILGLPRDAPFVDHLLALQAAARRSPRVATAQLSLIGLGLDDLRATASALLPAYRRRRRLRVLHELLVDPNEAEAAFAAMERAGAELPWLPVDLDAPADGWAWGFRAARRVHHLALDLLRVKLPEASPADRKDLLAARAAIDERLTELEQGRQAFEASSGVTAALRAIAGGADPVAALAPVADEAAATSAALQASVAATADALYAVSVALGEQDGVPVGLALFGEQWRDATEGLTPAMLAAFTSRVVAIEVVRRSFWDEETVDDAQRIDFAQITPDAPAAIFTERPFSQPYEASADRKLCGTILGHFGGFYRRSWRANDFLWGRLDASARIVEMLVGSHRTETLAATDQDQLWERLAKRLVAQGPEQCALIEEALADLPDPEPGELPLEQRLHNVLAIDLTKGEGRVTRLICARAVQFEILCEELPHLVREASDDLALGCSAADLGLDGLDLTAPADVLGAVHRLRAGEKTLPELLGRDDDAELASDLAVRTIARAGLVGLGVTRQASKIAMPLTGLRSLLLPMAGAVSQHARDRLGVVVAFGAVVLYLAARAVSADPAPTVDALDVSFSGLVLAVLALLIVIGTAAVPIARAGWGPGRGRVLRVAAALLVVVAGLGGIVVAWASETLTWAHLVVAPGVEPPWWATLLPLALGAGAAFVGPRPLRKGVAELARPAWRGTWSLALTAVAALILASWSAGEIAGVLDDGERWQQIVSWLAIAATPVALLAVVALPALAPRLRRPAPRAAAAAAPAAHGG